MKLKFAIVIALAAILSLTSVYAQDKAQGQSEDAKKADNPPQTLFSGSDFKLSGYGAPVYQLTRINGKAAHLAGGRGGLIINDSFVVGLAGFGLAHPQKREKLSGSDYTGEYPYMNFGYGGVLYEYHFFAKSLFHFSLGAVIGGGGITFDSKNEDDNHGNKQKKDKRFFVVEPEIGGYVNLTRFCRIGVLASYRFTKGANIDEFEDKDFRSFGGSVAAEFGWF
jgi:hypothetical protein